MKRAGFYLGYGLLGLAAGVGSALAWRNVLGQAVSAWVIAVVAVLCVLAVELLISGARWRRAARRSRRRAHARPKTMKLRRAA